MRYYKFHVGDYVTHTKHLTHMEDLAYRRMLDDYYLHEKPLAGSPQRIARQIGMADHADAVREVLVEFFDCDEDGPTWSQRRVDAELANAEEQRKQASAAGKKSAAIRASKKGRSTSVKGASNDRSTDPQLPTTHNPLPNTQEKTGGRFTPPTVMEVAAYCAERNNHIDPQEFIDHYEANGWVQGKGKKIKDWKACVRTWEAARKRRANPPADGKRSSRDVPLEELINDRSWAE